MLYPIVSNKVILVRIKPIFISESTQPRMNPHSLKETTEKINIGNGAH